MLLSTVLNPLIFKYVKTAIEDHEIFIVVVNPSTISNIAIIVDCLFSKSILPIVQFVSFNIQEIHSRTNKVNFYVAYT